MGCHCLLQYTQYPYVYYTHTPDPKEKNTTIINLNLIIRKINLHVNSLCVSHFPWTVAHWAPLSMGFSQQDYWSGLPFPPPRNLMGRHRGGGARLRDARGRPCRQWFELGVHQKCDGKPVPVCKHVRYLLCFPVTTLDHAAGKSVRIACHKQN